MLEVFSLGYINALPSIKEYDEGRMQGCLEASAAWWVNLEKLDQLRVASQYVALRCY